MHCHLHRGDWTFHLTNEKKKNSSLNDLDVHSRSQLDFVVKLREATQMFVMVVFFFCFVLFLFFFKGRCPESMAYMDHVNSCSSCSKVEAFPPVPLTAATDFLVCLFCFVFLFVVVVCLFWFWFGFLFVVVVVCVFLFVCLFVVVVFCVFFLFVFFLGGGGGGSSA